MVDGEIVVRDGRLTRVDIESLYKELKGSLTRPPSPQEIERSEFSKQLEPYLHRFYEETIGELSQPHYQYNARY